MVGACLHGEQLLPLLQVVLLVQAQFHLLQVEEEPPLPCLTGIKVEEVGDGVVPKPILSLTFSEHPLHHLHLVKRNIMLFMFWKLESEITKNKFCC